MDNSESTQSRLLCLPLELRLAIYEYLLLPSKIPSTAQSISVTNLLPDFHTYYSSDTNEDPFTLSVRTIDPWLSGHGNRSWRRRSTYHVRTGPFLTTTTPTTYRILLSPYTAHLRHTVPSLLTLNRQIHAEAAKILYSTYTFNFHTNIEAAVPFFTDLTPPSRSSIRHITLTKKALPYTKEFDRAEWASLCKYLPTALILRSLKLNVVAGKPGDEGWDDVAPITAQDFQVMLRMRKEFGSGRGAVGGVDLEWVEQLMAITGLRELQVRALVEHCPTPRSDALAFWVAFSKSVEQGGFGDWVRGAMVGSL